MKKRKKGETQDFDTEDLNDAPFKKGKKKKLSRAEKKALKKQQTAYEKQLVAEGKIAPRYRYVPRNTFARILSVCLALILGIFAAFGLLVGGFALAGTQKIKSVLDTAGVNEEDYSKYLSPNAYDLSILDLIAELSQMQLVNMNSIAYYSPFVETTLNAVSEQLAAAGINLDTEELMAVNFSEFGSYFQSNVIMGITLADVLKVENTDDSDAIMRAICYKENGDKTTINDLVNGATDLIMDLKVESLLGIDANSDAMLRYLAYGTEGEDYDIVNGTVVMRAGSEKTSIGDLTSGKFDVFGNLTIGSIVDVDENSAGILQAIKDWTITDLSNQTRIERLKISQIMNLDGDSSLIMQAIRDWRIADFTDQNKFNSLTLANVIEVGEDAPAILKSLKDTRLGDFSATIDDLTIIDILGEESISGNQILKNLGTSTLNTLSDDIANLTVEQVFGEDIYSYLSVSQMKSVYNAALAQYLENGGSENDVGKITTGSYAEIMQAYAKNSTIKEMSEVVPVPVELGENETVQTYYTYRSEEVTLGWFLNGTLLDESVTVYASANGYYIQTRTEVAPVYEWGAVNYDTGAIDPLADGSVKSSDGGFVYETNGGSYSILEDSYSAYYVYPANGKNVRVDLEKSIAGYVLNDVTYAVNGMGDLLIPDGNSTDAYRVYTETQDGETVYYVLLRDYVEEDFHTASGVRIDGEAETHWRTNNGEELDRYLESIWYLLFAEEKDGVIIFNTTMPVLDITGAISEAVKINNMPLSELYLHGFIEESPFVDISKFGFKNSETNETYVNLNQLSISEVIRFIGHLAQ